MNDGGAITYEKELDLSPADYIDILERSGLSERRPVHDRPLMAKMLGASHLVLTARAGGRLVGISRCLVDHGMTCYCADLAVDRDYQGRGIGRELLLRSWDAAGRQTSLHLLSAPAAVGFYERLPMDRMDRCFWWPAEEGAS